MSKKYEKEGKGKGVRKLMKKYRNRIRESLLTILGADKMVERPKIISLLIANRVRGDVGV